MPRSILVAEDEATPGRALVDELTEAGHAVRWTRSMRETRAELDRGIPDLLIIDARLDAAGLELVQALRLTPREPRAGVVVVAEQADVRSHEHALQLGAAGVLVKPVRTGEVAPLVADLLAFLDTQ